MQYDYSKLKGRIREIFGTDAAFADAIGLSARSVSLKLNMKRAWTQPDMEKAAEVLKFPEDEIQTYFFTRKVQ